MAVVKFKEFDNKPGIVTFPYYPECPYSEPDPDYHGEDKNLCSHPNRPYPHGIRRCLSHHIVNRGEPTDCPFGKGE